VTAVVGYDGLSVGGEFRLNKDAKPKYNVGAQYTSNDFVATLKT
jgi:hypothetical protein